MVKVDVTVIGAGAVGLCVACELGTRAGQVVVLEREPGPGRGTSSRSSEVVHAGIYYPPGSLKARLCVEGAALLKKFCESSGVGFLKIGKVIVAASGREEQAIERLYRTGMENGVRDLKVLGRRELKALEPNVSGVCALCSPCTGIVDSHLLTRRLEALCLDQGSHLLYRTRLTGLEKTPTGFTCTVCGPDGAVYPFASRVVVNAAGLQSDEVACLAGIDPDAAGYRIHPVKGEYFRVRAAKQHLVRGLVYPVPERSLTGLGIHATKDLSGSLRLGPNATPVKAFDYDVDPCHAVAFFESARCLLPFLEPEDLSPDTAGIRPKIQVPGRPLRDFVIRHEADRGLEGLINLVGIESPGLTASPAIGRYVAGMARDAGLVP